MLPNDQVASDGYTARALHMKRLGGNTKSKIFNDLLSKILARHADNRVNPTILIPYHSVQSTGERLLFVPAHLQGLSWCHLLATQQPPNHPKLYRCPPVASSKT
ncbi:expressed unknown protein [Seminavis robusta]|uniref:Uncharacterized protein n=1 Tax=Seminavis robusta TaxID=568900 RepID=A0A9N8ELH1_9STRA|nr:expressed unknown protein [Seminavis robusta]|eukprot:Sro1165_g248080.1 n/a (104) ;mRNA; f:12766-13169